MTYRLLAAVALVATLSGCGGDEKTEAPAPKAEAKAKPAPKKNVNQPVEDAMAQIPPEMRVNYQKAFTCEVKRNNAVKGSKAIDVTPAYVRDLTARLKARPSIAEC